MRGPVSLQLRLALVVGLGVTLFWLLAAVLTGDRAAREISAIFDAELRATAEQLLPLALHDLRRRGDDDGALDHDSRVAGFDDEDGPRGNDRGGPVAYRISDRSGRLILRSEGAEDNLFPANAPTGFSDTATHRIYVTSARDGVSIAVAEPLADREAMSRGLMLRLVMPLAVLLPLGLIGVVLAVRRGLRPLRSLQQGLAERGAQDLSPLPDADLPTELRPIAEALNQLLGRLRSAFDAERSFAANAAHELRTPVAGAIAQIQRLRVETGDAATAQRAGEIESTLKRLMRSSEKLMQLARAEGGRMHQEQPSDMRPVVRVLVGDVDRSMAGRCVLHLPANAVLSAMEPDALGILLRNLIENALRHGTPDTAVDVALHQDGTLIVTNAGPVLSADEIRRFGAAFEKGAQSSGAGLGLAIVRRIADRAGAVVTFQSPAPGRKDGLAVSVALPVSARHSSDAG